MSATIDTSIPLSSLVPVVVEHSGKPWSLYRVDAGEPRMLDVEWAQKLGYAQPRDIRKLIKRMGEAGVLGQVICATMAQNAASDGTGRGRPAVAYLLTKAQALKVAAKSETVYADAILDDMIAVYLKVANAHTVPAKPALALPPVMAPSMSATNMAQLRAFIAEKFEDHETAIGLASATLDSVVSEHHETRTQVQKHDAEIAKLNEKFTDIKDYVDHAAELATKAPDFVVDLGGLSGRIRFPADVTRSVLEHIALYPRATQSSTARLVGIPVGTLSQMYRGFYRTGWLVRSGSKYAPIYTLTPAGLAKIGKPVSPQLSLVVSNPEPGKSALTVAEHAAPSPSTPCGNGSLARVQFRNHMQIIGGCLKWSEDEYQKAYNAIYARMADVGHDPRGKTEMDSKKKVRKIAPIEYLDRMGWAAEALQIAHSDFPLSMIPAQAVR